MTDLKAASRSALDVSIKAMVMFRRLVAYFFLAMTMCCGFFVTFDRPAYPTEDTALLNAWLANNRGQMGDEGKSTLPVGKFEMIVTGS
jgi:hypothetical protein